MAFRSHKPNTWRSCTSSSNNTCQLISSPKHSLPRLYLLISQKNSRWMLLSLKLTPQRNLNNPPKTSHPQLKRASPKQMPSLRKKLRIPSQAFKNHKITLSMLQMIQITSNRRRLYLRAQMLPLSKPQKRASLLRVLIPSQPVPPISRSLRILRKRRESNRLRKPNSKNSQLMPNKKLRKISQLQPTKSLLLK